MTRHATRFEPSDAWGTSGTDSMKRGKPLQLDTHIRWMIRRDQEEVLYCDSRSYHPPLDAIQLLHLLKDRSAIGMVATDRDEKIMGFMIYALHPKHLQILRLAVDPLFRRHGVGTSMIARLQSKLSPTRRHTIDAISSDTNLRAHMFLSHRGFRAEGVIQDHFGSHHDGYYFAYRLPVGQVADQESLTHQDD